MTAFVVFNVALVFGAALIMVFVMTWRDIFLEECHKNKRHLLRVQNHPFTNLAFLREILIPFLAVCVTAVIFGFELFTMHDRLLDCISAFLVLLLYCATQYQYMVGMSQFSAQ